MRKLARGSDNVGDAKRYQLRLQRTVKQRRTSQVELGQCYEPVLTRREPDTKPGEQNA